jgi:hypothetical protein
MTREMISGSYMHAGDNVPYWDYYRDRYASVQLAAEICSGGVLAFNERLSAFVMPQGVIAAPLPMAFFPPALSAGVRDLVRVDATMTGGRTFLLSRAGAKSLGLSERLYIDLEKLGWGEGKLEVRPEIKGAGTVFARTRLSPGRLRQILAKYPELNQSYNRSRARSLAPIIMSSLAIYQKRNLGGQSERYARHEVDASRALLDRSKIKFVPAWIAVAYSGEVRRNLSIVSQALPANEERFAGICASVIRFTPGSVRAVYFDKISADDELAYLCSRVSNESDELEETLHHMIDDSRRYLEVIAKSTRPSPEGGFTWIKVGDINEKFRINSSGEYADAAEYRRRKYAWFLAKDEIVVRKVGKFFTDMESYFGKDVGYHSRTESDLKLHHELYILTVLRDHNRICTRFKIGLELFQGRRLSLVARASMSKGIMRDIIAAINESPYLHIDATQTQIACTIKYENLANQTQRYVFPRAQLAELEG